MLLSTRKSKRKEKNKKEKKKKKEENKRKDCSNEAKFLALILVSTNEPNLVTRPHCGRNDTGPARKRGEALVSQLLKPPPNQRISMNGRIPTRGRPAMNFVISSAKEEREEQEEQSSGRRNGAEAVHKSLKVWTRFWR